MVKKTQSQTLESLIHETVERPRGFEKMVAGWNSHFADIQKIETSLTEESGFELAARNALHALEKLETRSANDQELARIVNRFPHAALLVQAQGRIVACNLAANRSLVVDVGQNISEIGYSLTGAEPIGDLVASAIKSARSDGQLTLKPAYDDTNGHGVTIAISSVQQKGDNAPMVMVFVIDPVWHRTAQELIQKAYDLTEAETQVLVAFVRGQTIHDIAKQRNRSEATVRVQFQAILSKSGAHNQAELLRSTLALSQFVGQIEDVSHVARHPNRRTAQILRPGGRMVEVTLAGDLTGSPVVFLPSVSQYTFPEYVEAALKTAGLLMLSICRPGWGGTDVPQIDDSSKDCLADDIKAVQEQLGINKCPLLVHSTSTPHGYVIANLIPERINRLIVLSGFPPPSYMDAHKTASPWTSALQRVGTSSPALIDFMLRTGLKAWRLMGSKRFLGMQYKGSGPDVDMIERPDCVAEFDKAMMAATANGPEACLDDLIVGRSDWRFFVRDCKIPSLFIHGDLDVQSEIGAVHDFVADFRDTVSLCELKGSGFMTILSHTDRVIDLLGGSS